MPPGLPLPTKAQRQNARKRAVQIQLRLHPTAARGNRRDHGLLDQVTDCLSGVNIVIRLEWLVYESVDTCMIGLGHLGMDVRDGAIYLVWLRPRGSSGGDGFGSRSLSPKAASAGQDCHQLNRPGFAGDHQLR